MARLDELLRFLRQQGGSDLHLSAGRPPAFRQHGAVTPVPDWDTLDESQLMSLLQELALPDKWAAFLAENDLDFAYEIPRVGRFRCNYFRQQYGAGAVFRLIPEEIIPFEKLGLPEVLRDLADLEAGLVLVTGPTGSGKSTSLAAIVDRINARHAKHIVTIEDPIEFVHPNKRAVISQREVGRDAESFTSALHSAMRQDADVILVGEMRDLETIDLAITAASMGVLVFGTLHTNSAAKTVDRIIDAFPSDQQAQARTMLADSLAAVVSQILLKRRDGRGRVAAHEILLRTNALGGIIRSGSSAKLNAVIAGSMNIGMQTMDDTLLKLVETGKISGGDAYLKAIDKNRFSQYFEEAQQTAHLGESSG